MIAKAFKPARLAYALLPVCVLTALSASAAPTNFYSQPQPSNQEQYLLELINRARSNPAAEGQMLAGVTDAEILRYYSHYAVDTNKLKGDFAGYQAQPPLAMNADLMTSSRQQSLDQAANGFQGHDSSNGTHFDGRITATGYLWQAVGENVFAYVENPFFGHVGLNADWGVPDLDHRENIMNYEGGATSPIYKEVGISCVPTSVKNFGPLVVTEDFGTPRDSNVAYLVGVVYNDLNGNGAYDEGEGLGGVTVTPDGGSYYTTTSSSGGYVIPLPTDASGALTITVSGGSFGDSRMKTVNYTPGTNVKLDFTPGSGSPSETTQVSTRTVIKNATADGSQVGVITVSRTGNDDSDLTVALKIAGNAVSGVDYAPLPSSVTIPAGQDSVTITVEPLPQQFTTVKKVKFTVVPSANYVPDATAAVSKVKIRQ